MSDYIPPISDIILEFNSLYSPPLATITLRFTNEVAGADIVASANVIIDTIISNSIIEEYDVVDSVDVNIATTISNANVENYYGIAGDNVFISSMIAGLSIDGDITGDFRITAIPEIVNASVVIEATIPLTTLSGGLYESLPTKQIPPYRATWKQATCVPELDYKASWNEIAKTDTGVAVSFKQPFESDSKLQSEWKGKQFFCDLSGSVLWGQANIESEINNSMIYKNIMGFADESDGIGWDKFRLETSQTIETGYLQPPPKDTHEEIVWGGSIIIDKQKSFEFLQPPPNDKQHRTYWGDKWYSLLCKTQYFPPINDPIVLFKFKEIAIVDSPETEAILSFGTIRNLRCPFDYHHSGNRDPFHPPIIPPIPYNDILIVPISGTYYMSNTTYIRKLSGNMESIDFQSVTMSIDRDSWLWSFNIVVLTKESLDLIKPVQSNFSDIEISCNGWIWTCRVDGWKESIVFGKKAWTVTGKSPSMEIGDPYSSLSSYSNENVHGGQIIDDVLTDTGWTTEWQGNNSFIATSKYINDWLIPAGVVSVTNTSCIKIIQRIIDSIGYFIQTNANTNNNPSLNGTGNQVLYIKPTHKQNAWKWNENSLITPKAVLTDRICSEIGRSNKVVQPVQAVIVSGENHGVIVSAVRDGYNISTCQSAAVATEPLLTSIAAGTEKSRHIISQSGYWLMHSLRLFSLSAPLSAPGLLLPGDFIDMNETGSSTWRGQVIGVSINSGWSGNGLVTSQSIEVEQYVGS